MNSRERMIKAINHQTTDRTPIDLGATPITGISASTMFKLREAYGLVSKPVKVIEPFQILGQVEEDLMEAVGADVVGLWNPVNFMGIRNEGWKPWTMPDGTPTLMAGGFEYDLDKDGSTLVYPQGNRSCDHSMKLTSEGSFFNSIDRVGPMDESDLNPVRDFKEDFAVYSEEDARIIEARAKKLYEETDYGVVGNFGGGGFGDIAAVPGHFLKNPSGVRRMDEWMMLHLLHPDYLRAIYDIQLEVALKNLEIYRQAVGHKIQVIHVSGTDFGTQNGTFISPDIYRSIYMPYHKRINDWIHEHTNWKTFYHSCGAIADLLDDFVEAGVDIINPVQCSAKGMEAKDLKDKYQGKLVFWGGGVDTQHTLPFGTKEEVIKEVAERVKVLGNGGGYVFNTIHNIVANTPIENLQAMYKAVNG